MGDDLNARNPTLYILNGAVGSINTPKQKSLPKNTAIAIFGRFRRLFLAFFSGDYSLLVPF